MTKLLIVAADQGALDSYVSGIKPYRPTQMDVARTLSEASPYLANDNQYDAAIVRDGVPLDENNDSDTSIAVLNRLRSLNPDCTLVYVSTDNNQLSKAQQTTGHLVDGRDLEQVLAPIKWEPISRSS